MMCRLMRIGKTRESKGAISGGRLRLIRDGIGARLISVAGFRGWTEMERLTKNRNGKNVIPLVNAVCGFAMPYWRIDRPDDLHSYLSGDAADKLAAYEDTGLEPKEVAKAKKKLKYYEDRFDFRDAKRWDEITRAEDDGRLMILPCKVGERFWLIEDGSIREYLVGAFETTGYGDLTVYDYDGIDRSPAYFTREEAEKALEEGTK